MLVVWFYVATSVVVSFKIRSNMELLVSTNLLFIRCFSVIIIYTVPCWRYLLRINRLSHLIVPHFIYFRLHRRYYTTVELELSNSRTRELSNRRLSNPRTVDSRTLVFVDWLFSLSLANRFLIAH
jgi:hypothetical protein